MGNKPKDEDLVRKALAESRLIPGENPASKEPADVRHWISVYQELLGFKNKMLAELTETLPRMNSNAASEVEEIDQTLLGRQAERYRARLSFWEGRAREVALSTPATNGGD